MDVRSYITLSSDAPKAGLRQLPPPEYVEAVRAVPKELKGLERRYLGALQKNVRARKEYDLLLQKPTEQPRVSCAGGQATRLTDQIELLRLKKRHEELNILQCYMTKLKDTPAAKPGFLDLGRLRRHEPNAFPSAYQHFSGENGQTENSVDALVRRLEMAVICAKHQVDRERRLLVNIERDVASIPAQVRQSNRCRALAATRDELVVWIEDRLSSSQSNESGMIEKPPQAQQPGSPVVKMQGDVMEKYDKYIRLRTRMLELIGDLTTSIQHSEPEEVVHGANIMPRTTPYQPPTPSVLPFILTQIHNPTQIHRFYRQEKTHLASLINKEHSKTTSELSRLADESHLLPTYPMLDQPDRFKRATAALASNSLVNEGTADDEESEMSRRVEAWAFAADAAKAASLKTVSEHVDKGVEALEEGENWVARLKELLGDDDDCRQELGGDRDGNTDQSDGEEDVWAVEAAVGQLVIRKPDVKGMKGPWAGLQLDVDMKKPT